MLKSTFACAVAVSVLVTSGSAIADTKDKKIALSNNYAGNSWRQAMLKSWDKVTKPAVEATASWPPPIRSPPRRTR